ncbi:MAG TPA: hypothetical protein DIT76_09295 [Spartobacteria bacterium]|nr:hypothetical protein [Spartobacteria bacterium]
MFRIPYQSLRGPDSDRIRYVAAPGGTAADIAPSVLRLLDDVDDEEMIYWCADDKYPIQLVTDKIAALMLYVRQSSEISGLMFCRCRVTLERPDLALYPREWPTPSGDILLERRAWYQIWIHQFLKAKVLRYFFSSMPDSVPSAKAMDTLKNDIIKLADHRLFVTKENFAVFGESTQNGRMTRNCYDSIRNAGIELPQKYRRPSRKRVTMGKL